MTTLIKLFHLAAVGHFCYGIYVWDSLWPHESKFRKYEYGGKMVYLTFINFAVSSSWSLNRLLIIFQGLLFLWLIHQIPVDSNCVLCCCTFKRFLRLKQSYDNWSSVDKKDKRLHIWHFCFSTGVRCWRIVLVTLCDRQRAGEFVDQDLNTIKCYWKIFWRSSRKDLMRFSLGGWTICKFRCTHVEH